MTGHKLPVFELHFQTTRCRPTSEGWHYATLRSNDLQKPIQQFAAVAVQLV